MADDLNDFGFTIVDDLAERPPDDLPDKAYGPRDGEEDEKGNRNYVRTLIIQTSDKTVDQESILNSAAFPRIGDIWATESSVNPGIRVVRRSVSMSPDSPILWDLRLEYASFTETEGQDRKNPLLRPAVVSFRTQSVTKALEMAWNTDYSTQNEPVTNSAGDPYDPPQEIEDGYQIITIKKNMPSHDPVGKQDYLFHVNSATWWGFAPLSVLMTLWDAEETREDVVTYWATSWQFKVAKHGGPNVSSAGTWIRPILDAGQRERVPGIAGFFGGAVRPIFKDGHPVSKDVLLDGSGAQLAAGGTPVYRDFRVYPIANFNALMLP